MAIAIGTGNITLKDVTTHIYSDTDAGRTLAACFASATGIFNPTYVGNKDRLSNFKGYVNGNDGVWGVNDMVAGYSYENQC
tara:strand:+ start:46 stop:288 length:243 start_codon:yes stop_codon:yes gene_type:complete